MAMAPFPKRMLLVLLAIKWGDAVSEKEIYFPFFRPSWKMSPLLQRNPAIPSIVRKIKLYNEAATCRMARRKHPHSLREQILNDLWPANGQEWPMVKWVMAVVLVVIVVMVTEVKITGSGSINIYNWCWYPLSFDLEWPLFLAWWEGALREDEKPDRNR